MKTRCNNIVRYQVSHAWRNSTGKWTVSLVEYNSVIMDNEQDYRQAIKAGYVEIEVNIESR